MKELRMLYLSCHSILEHDEVKLFTELGIDVFSHGAFLDPNAPDDPMRPGFPGKRHDHFIELARKHPKERLPREFVEPFDVVYVQHISAWIINNWEVFKDKIVIWRSIGQSSRNDENRLRRYRARGLKIVRYSPMERVIPGYVGEDAVIRFYKDPDEYKDWNGETPQVINVTQSLKYRGAFCGYEHFMQATDGFPRKVYGPHNENLGDIFGGFLPYEKLKQAYRDNRAYFYTGTIPACYTLNFIEAYMTGIPIVAIGPGLGNPPYLPRQKTYEIQNLIIDGETGFVSDDIEQLRERIKLLMDQRDVADRISRNARKRAIELFGKEKIKKQWKEFFETL